MQNAHEQAAKAANPKLDRLKSKEKGQNKADTLKLPKQAKGGEVSAGETQQHSDCEATHQSSMAPNQAGTLAPLKSTAN